MMQSLLKIRGTKMLLWSLVALLFATVSWAQRPQPSPAVPVGSIVDTSFPARLGQSVQGTLPLGNPHRRGGFIGYGTVGVPYLVPPPPPPLWIQQVNAPAVVIEQQIMPPEPVESASASREPVIYQVPMFNQSSEPEPTKNKAEAASDDVSKEPLYVIAFQDGNAVMAIAYWTDGKQLKYVTFDRKQKQAALSQVDRKMSERLNRERNVDFRLP